MEQLVGVRFHEAGKIYYFASAGYEQLEVGEYVVVETSRGQELARVVIAPGQVLNAELTEPLKPITRVAFDEDLEQAERLRKKAESATDIARQKARRMSLPMKVVSGSYDLDGARLTLLFTSEGRIDFRDLIREVSDSVGSEVQLRQVGPRDQAKVVGGYGRCGRRLCCTSWLVAFPAISIKMAKEQDLPLNPSKISGQCGRLLCCLSYENDMYRKVRQALPRPGTYVSTPTGNARILSVNVPRETVTLQMETMQIVDLSIEEMGLDRGLVRVLDGPPPPSVPPPPPPRPATQHTAHPAPVPAAPRAPIPRAPMSRRPAIAPGEPADARPAAASRPPAPASRPNAPDAAAPANPAQQAAPARQGPAGHRRRRRRGGPGPRPQPPQ
jgi:cell fate regulator YaaT (PSP1 superfamily)